MRTRATMRTLAAAALLPMAPLAAQADERYAVDPETGYRMERYRAPVPASVPGGVTLDTAAMRARVADDTIVLVDVFPPKGLGADPLDGTWIVSEGHATLPGAIWLPEVGRGHLSAEHEVYFRRNLERLSGGDRATPLVFFCTADCWQSWNAAKRASGWGYTDVHWYPLGTDGWAEEGGALVPARPLNFFDDSLPEVAPGGESGTSATVEPSTDADGPGADVDTNTAVSTGGSTTATTNATGAAETSTDETSDTASDTKETTPARATTGSAENASIVFPSSARIALVDGDGVELEIGTVRFGTNGEGGSSDDTDAGENADGPDAGNDAGAGDTDIVPFDVTLDGAPFSDHFLSMRPFRCVTGEPEWFCHLPYPYALDDTVSEGDLTDLEYRLLFLVKAPDEFGIDAWNGVYYRLTPRPDGGFDGALLEGDLNVLAAPPEDPDTRPIDLAEFIGEDADARRFPRLVIRP